MFWGKKLTKYIDANFNLLIPQIWKQPTYGFFPSLQQESAPRDLEQPNQEQVPPVSCMFYFWRGVTGVNG